MAVGIEIRRPDGRLLFDTSDIGGLVAILVTAPAGTGTTTQSLPAFTGRNVQPVSADPEANAGVTVTYPGGVPTVAVPQVSTGQRAVFVLVE
jgi:hypothetical protein